MGAYLSIHASDVRSAELGRAGTNTHTLTKVHIQHQYVHAQVCTQKEDTIGGYRHKDSDSVHRLTYIPKEENLILKE